MFAPCRPASAASLLLAAAALSACGKKEQPAPPPPLVEVVTLAPHNVANVIELPGRVQAVRTAEVRARVDGIVERRLYEEGTDVRAGQALFRIDPRQNRAAYNAANAALARAEAGATNAAQVVRRYRPLVGQQAISSQEYDAAVASQRQSQADAASARAQVERARLDLDYTVVTAPIAGRAGRAQVTEGALVSAGSATLMTTVEQLNPVYVNFSQSRGDLLKLRRDMASGAIRVPQISRIRVVLELEDGTRYGPAGHLDFLDQSVDESTGTVSIRAEFPNPQAVLLPGQFVRARIEGGVATQGISVPQRAVQISPQGASVLVVGPNNIAAARSIRLGELQGNEWVVRDGLKPGDRVIVNGVQKARPGSPVRIAPPRAARPAPQPAPAARSPRP